MQEKKTSLKRYFFLARKERLNNIMERQTSWSFPRSMTLSATPLLEAMASGLPVITTKNNGVAETIENGQEGYVLDDSFNGEELADKISLSLKEREKIAKNARKRAEAFPIEKAARELREVIGLVAILISATSRKSGKSFCSTRNCQKQERSFRQVE